MNSDTPPSETVPGMDARAAQRWRLMPRRQSPWLHEEVASRMAQRLQWFRQPPASWLHWEPVLGGLQSHGQLKAQLANARAHVWAERLDEARSATGGAAARSWNPLRRLRPAPSDRLEEGAQVGLLWSNMLLHHVAQPQSLLQRWHGLIETDGFLMFSCLGPDSLQELRTVYAREGWAPPCHAFTDMHDWGDMLVHGGFAEPVMDMERIVLSYSSVDALLEELRGLGRNLAQDRFPGVRGRGWRGRLRQALDAGLPRDEQGRLLLSFEIIYGHACKAAPRVARSGDHSVSLDEMRAQLRRGRG